MKARLVPSLPADNAWLLEVKLDGIRAIGVKDGDKVQLFSRLPRELTAEYPAIDSALQELPARRFVVDGEIVAVDAEGRSSFQLLQNRRRLSGSNRPPIFFYLFDLLNLDGRDLTSQTLVERKAELMALAKTAEDPLRVLVPLEADITAVWKQIKKLGLEGLIAKRPDSVYEAGRRSGAWIKVKAHNEQEFVIGGYTPPQGSRPYFGSLLIGYYEGEDLICASRVGTGFDTDTLRSLYNLFQKHRITKSPFVNLPARSNERQPIVASRAELKEFVWIEPKFVCQVRFMEWTSDGNLRHPVFLGLRQDKSPREVKREQVRSSSKAE